MSRGGRGGGRGGAGRGSGGGGGGDDDGGGGSGSRSEEWDTKTALAICPPKSVWAPIQQIRAKHDKAYERWPPHINLIFPFQPLTKFSDAAKKISTVVKSIKPISVVVKNFGSFDHGKSHTVWCRPDTSSAGGDEKAIEKLQAAIQVLFPHNTDTVTKSEHGFRPHLTLGQWAPREVTKAITTIEGVIKPFEWGLDQVVLLARADVNDPFHVRATVMLGTGKITMYDRSGNVESGDGKSSAEGESSKSAGDTKEAKAAAAAAAKFTPLSEPLPVAAQILYDGWWSSAPGGSVRVDGSAAAAASATTAGAGGAASEGKSGAGTAAKKRAKAAKKKAGGGGAAPTAAPFPAL